MFPEPLAISGADSFSVNCLVEGVCRDAAVGDGVGADQAVAANDSALFYGGIGGQPDMVADGYRDIGICQGIFAVADGMMVAVIDDHIPADHNILAQLNTLCGNKDAAGVGGEEPGVQKGILQDFQGDAIGESASAFVAPYRTLAQTDQGFCFGTGRRIAANLHVTAAEIDPGCGMKIQNRVLVREDPAVICPDHIFAEVIQIQIPEEAQLAVQPDSLQNFIDHRSAP